MKSYNMKSYNRVRTPSMGKRIAASNGEESPIDRQFGSRHEGCLVRKKPDGGGGDLLRNPDSSQRVTGSKLFDQIGKLRIGYQRLNHRRVHCTGQNGVDADTLVTVVDAAPFVTPSTPPLEPQ